MKRVIKTKRKEADNQPLFYALYAFTARPLLTRGAALD